MVENGCDLHSTCKTCPYPDCYEGNLKKVGQYNRELKARELESKGLNQVDIALKLGVCRQTIRRDLGGVR